MLISKRKYYGPPRGVSGYRERMYEHASRERNHWAELWERVKKNESLDSKKFMVVWNRNGIPKGIAVKSGSEKNGFEYSYYPQLEHLELFVDAGNYVAHDGPAFHHPGAVGTLGTHKQTNKGKSEINIRWVQGQFKTGKPESLTRKIATEYGGWKQHLLIQILEEARANGSVVAIDLNSAHELFQKHGLRKLMPLLKKCAENCGFDIRESKQKIEAIPSRKL